MAAGGSAQRRADELRTQAWQARAKADALETEAGAWAAGAEGERRVAASLSRLPTGWHVFHDRLLRPGRSETNLDHVLIGPSGVYLVDTKNWAGGTSVHEGNLWQHASGSSSKGRELDNVSRFAGEMERVLGLPVVPVVALVGAGSSSFVQQRVRGVEVVPHHALVAWLLAQPGAADIAETRLTSRLVENTYPPATSDVPPAPEPLTVPDVVAAHRPSTHPVNPRRHARRPTARRPRVARAVLALIGFLVLEWLAPHLPSLLAARTTAAVTVPAPGAQPSSSGAKSCQALSSPAIARITGSRTVLDRATGSPDQCGWWLSRPRYTTQGPDITVETGFSARMRLATSGTTAARVDRLPGDVSAWLPQGTRLDGWAVGTRARQPFFVSLRFTYPPGTSLAQARALEAAYEMKVVRLAETLAAGLPAVPAT